MDQREFDRMTQLVSAAESRRQALRTLLGAALVGVARGEAAAKPKDKKVRTGRRDCGNEPCPSQVFKGICCKDGSCSCGQNRECCSGKCFWDRETNPTKEFCCQGAKWEICGDPKSPICCQRDNENPCSCIGPGVITGSYRRR
jgi:hypothetical protein